MEELKPAKPLVNFDFFTQLDLRVARVLECRPHPNADKLLILQVDLGTEKRQICSILRSHYQPADLIGKLVIVVANIEPRSMRGEPSQGVILTAASGISQQHFAIISPLQEVPPGSVVS